MKKSFYFPIGSAFKSACITDRYTSQRFIKDLIAGVTVGIIAIPLAMALAIASGVAPQNGLYTAIIAGIIIALTGGSRLSVSGPTAAFVVILYPVTQQFGLSGLLFATFLSGVFLIIMGAMKLGRLIEYIPMSVVIGFTCGIGITIATMQLKDFFGLTLDEMPESYIGKINALFHAFPTFKLADTIVGFITLAILIIWPKLKLKIPGHLPAIILSILTMLILNAFDFPVKTIGSSFTYVLADGSIGNGIPAVLPELILPWQISDFDWNWQTIQDLIPIAFVMAILCAIESLLCAVVLDTMSKTKYNANGELIGQGLGNLLAPFFGAIPATAAIARSAANVKAGATSPIAACIHSLTILLALISLAGLLSYLPLSSMAALLLIVAWHMSDVKKVIEMIKKAPKDDILVLLLCLFLTVLFDMVIAISCGIILAAILFLRRIARMTRLVILPQSNEEALVVRVNGALFFAAADKIFLELNHQLHHLPHFPRSIIMQWDAVSVLDSGGTTALVRFIDELPENICLTLCDIPFQPLRTLARAKITPIPGKICFYSTLAEALEKNKIGQ